MGQIMREIRRCTWIVSSFRDSNSALMVVAVRLRQIASIKWGNRGRLSMEEFDKNALEIAKQMRGESPTQLEVLASKIVGMSVFR